jgi:hypothetical protein
MALPTQPRNPLPGKTVPFNPAVRMLRAQAELRSETEETLRELAFVYHAVRTVRTAMTGRSGLVSRMLD